MSAIGLPPRPERAVDRLEVTWLVFAVCNLAAMLVLPAWQTTPFHFIWISLTVLYGVRVWALRKTAVVLVLIVLTTGAAMLRAQMIEGGGFDEITEVPLMAGIFVAMVWHAQRRERAMAELARMAQIEHRTLERERAFVRSASHELRTPVTVARGHAELIGLSVDDPQTSADLQVVIGELDRLSHLTDRLLTIAASAAPSFLVRREVDVAALLRECVGRWAPVADRIWRCEAPHGVVIDADPQRLGVALDALVENSIEYSLPGTAIELSAVCARSRVRIAVADSGIGIVADALEHVFEPFARADPRRLRTTGGTGLGLSIVRAIVEAHDGTVSASSVLGAGTTITLELPTRPALAEVVAASGPLDD